MSSNSQFQFIKCCIVSSNECSYKSYTSELYSPRIFNIDIPMINYQNAWYFFFIIINMYMVHLFSNNDVALTASIFSVKHHNKVYREVQSPATPCLSWGTEWYIYITKCLKNYQLFIFPWSLSEEIYSDERDRINNNSHFMLKEGFSTIW